MARKVRYTVELTFEGFTPSQWAEHSTEKILTDLNNSKEQLVPEVIGILEQTMNKKRVSITGRMIGDASVIESNEPQPEEELPRDVQALVDILKGFSDNVQVIRL